MHWGCMESRNRRLCLAKVNRIKCCHNQWYMYCGPYSNLLNLVDSGQFYNYSIYYTTNKLLIILLFPPYFSEHKFVTSISYFVIDIYGSILFVFVDSEVIQPYDAKY